MIARRIATAALLAALALTLASCKKKEEPSGGGAAATSATAKAPPGIGKRDEEERPEPVPGPPAPAPAPKPVEPISARQRAVEKYAQRLAKERQEKTAIAKSQLDAAEVDLKATTKTRDDEWDAHQAVKAKAKGKLPVKQADAFRDRNATLNTAIDNQTRNRDQLKKPLADAEQWVPRTDPRELKPGEVTMFGVQGQMPVFVVFQVIDKKNMLAKFGDELFWIEEANTSGIADGKQVAFESLIESTGTKQYANTVGGTRTVISFRYYETK